MVIVGEVALGVLSVVLGDGLDTCSLSPAFPPLVVGRVDSVGDGVLAGLCVGAGETLAVGPVSLAAPSGLVCSGDVSGISKTAWSPGASSMVASGYSLWGGASGGL